MDNRTDILNELKNISELVAAIGNKNVFTVPEGYFESISPTIMVSVKDQDGPDFIPAQNDIPEGYFDNLAGNILNRINGELNESEALPAIFSSIKKNIAFELPAGYFDSLSDNILSKIKEQNEALPTVLSGLNKINPFEVPGDYFNQLADDILTKVKNDTGARVIKMPVRFKALKYAVAAMFTGAIALGVYKFTTKPGVGINQPATAVALEPSIEKGKTMDDKIFTESLASLSEDDIVKYLEKNGNEADVSLLTSNVEGLSLPQQEDYLLDNNTLDNFLNEIKSSSN